MLWGGRKWRCIVHFMLLSLWYTCSSKNFNSHSVTQWDTERGTDLIWWSNSPASLNPRGLLFPHFPTDVSFDDTLLIYCPPHDRETERRMPKKGTEQYWARKARQTEKDVINVAGLAVVAVVSLSPRRTATMSNNENAPLSLLKLNKWWVQKMNHLHCRVFKGRFLMSIKQMNYWVREMRRWVVHYGLLGNILTFVKLKLARWLFKFVFLVSLDKNTMKVTLRLHTRILISLSGGFSFLIFSPDESGATVYISALTSHTGMKNKKPGSAFLKINPVFVCFI